LEKIVDQVEALADGTLRYRMNSYAKTEAKDVIKWETV
jgi:hypothetical protein